MKTTEDRIIFIVIVAIASCSVVYVLATAWLAMVGAEPKPTVAQAFNHVGDVLIGALIGLLMKTKPAPVGPPLSTDGSAVKTEITNEQPIEVHNQPPPQQF